MPLRDPYFADHLEPCTSCVSKEKHHTMRRCRWCAEPTCAQCLYRDGACPDCSTATHKFKSKGRGDRRGAPAVHNIPRPPPVAYAYGFIEANPNRGT